MDNPEKILTMGVDIGSTASKCLILEDGKKIISTFLDPYGAGTSGPKRAMESALTRCGLEMEQISYMLATGYGRNTIESANYQMSELSCHSMGAHLLFPTVQTVIDIGGQDIKVLRIGATGILENFVMNEKCAAGTGRFLEVMAKILEVEIDDMARLSAESTERVDISSTCTVFAESEVISQLSKKKDKRDIICGIHRSVAVRVAGLVKRIGVLPPVVLTGGVARNSGVLLALQDELGVEIQTSPYAQYAGALGAACFAYQRNI